MKQAIGRAVMTKMGPNNARCVIWALSEFFYILNRVFLILTYILLYIQLLSTKQAIGRAVMTKMRPKRCQMHCLGPT